MKKKTGFVDELLGFWAYRMHTESAAVLKRTLQATGYDVTPEQFALMVRLHENPGINHSQLGEKAFKDRHNTNRIIRQLEKRGFIKRSPSESDKRVYSLFLTETGRAVKEALVPIVLDHYAAACRDIPSEDLKTVRRVLKRIVKNLKGQRIE
jgi:DNA-binding MarR family transcriptional regulator